MRSAPVRVPSQRPLAPSAPSVMSVANDKGNNGMIPRAVHRSPPYRRGKTRKNSTRRPSDEWASHEVPYLQMRSVGSQSTSGKDKEGKRERTKYWLVSNKIYYSNHLWVWLLISLLKPYPQMGQSEYHVFIKNQPIQHVKN